MKLQRVEDLSGWDTYRGQPRIAWRLLRFHVEEFAVGCPCGAWWGWTPDLDRARRLRDRAAAKGCPRCNKVKKVLARVRE